MVSKINNHSLLDNLPIFGIIHLAGDKPVIRALEELSIFEEEGITGAIIENYHGSIGDVIGTLQETSQRKNNLVIGINILPNYFEQAFSLAQQYKADFIQLDHVAGRYDQGELNFPIYSSFKRRHKDTLVLGGVWPKYYHPIDGSNLDADLRERMTRAEAIVVTGAGTGKETPLDKIRRFKEVMGGHSLIIGAGLTPENAYRQLLIADGAIVGTSLKLNNNPCEPVDRLKVRDFMSQVKEARTYKINLK